MAKSFAVRSLADAPPAMADFIRRIHASGQVAVLCYRERMGDEIKIEFAHPGLDAEEFDAEQVRALAAEMGAALMQIARDGC